MTIKEIRSLSGLSRAAFGRKYHIPIRTLENWDAGSRECPGYVKELLERAVREDFNIYEEETKMKKVWIVEEITREMRREERRGIMPGCTLNGGADLGNQEIKRYDSKEEAMEALEEYEPSVKKFTNAGMVFYMVTEYAVEEVTLDEDDFPVESAGWDGMRADWRFEDGEMIFD